jgi:diguanylate cyclase (GGDEF)-like protein
MLLDEAREAMRSQPLDRRRNRHAMRISQVSPLGLISLFYALGLFVFYQQGFIGGATFISAMAVVLAFVILFYSVFRLGLNVRFNDQTLMLPQLLSVLMIMLAVAYLERSTQIALVPFILIAFSFGIFRLTTISLVLLAVGCLGAYLGMILMRGHHEGYTFSFRADLMQWFVLALTLPGMILVARQIQNLRQTLKTTRYRLEHYEEKSIRDELTGLFNRRQLQVELEQAKLQACTRAVPFSICLIDIDHFKEINDGNGHLAGDKILRNFAYLARHTIRNSDVFGRYGGDEFLLILADTDAKGAVVHAERLRVYAHFLDFQKILPQKHISLSIGVAQYRTGDTITDLIARADQALYRSKQLGRNRVEWMEVEEPTQAAGRTGVN